MKIKNVKELQLRANAHARLDHYRQGTYGSGKTNGHTEYRGCAVGCLATPHRKDDLRDFIITHGKKRGDWYEVNFAGPEQREMIEGEFGICEDLIVVAEGFFEAQPTHGGAIEFVKRFSHSLNEGSDFDGALVEAWCLAVFKDAVTNWEDVSNYISSEIDYEDDGFAELCAKLTKEFLAFCADPTKIPETA